MVQPKVEKWVLTPHAAQRIAERKISVDELGRVISAPDFVVEQGPKWIFVKALKGRLDNRIAAVLLERKEEDLWVVITAMVRFERK